MIFMSCCNIEPDELHVLYLGVVMYMLGSLLWLLTYRVMTGTPASNMERLWGMICSKYSLLKTENQYGGLRLSNFIDPDHPHKAYPKLKGRGGEVKMPNPGSGNASLETLNGNGIAPHRIDRA